MCHSVEMYLPKMARTAAEERVGQPCGAEAGAGLRGIFAGLVRLLNLEQALKPLKNKEPQFERVSWLTKRDASATPAAVAAGAGK